MFIYFFTEQASKRTMQKRDVHGPFDGEKQQKHKDNGKHVVNKNVAGDSESGRKTDVEIDGGKGRASEKLHKSNEANVTSTTDGNGNGKLNGKEQENGKGMLISSDLHFIFRRFTFILHLTLSQ